MNDPAVSRAIDTAPLTLKVEDTIDSILHRIEMIKTNFPAYRMEVVKYLAEIELAKITKKDEPVYWFRLSEDITSLEEAIQLNELLRASQDKESQIKEIPEGSHKSDLETNKPLFKNVGSEPVRKKMWAEEEDESPDDDQVFEDLRSSLRGAKDTNIIRLPEDFEEMWPLGFSVITKAAENNGFVVIKDRDLNFSKSGFSYPEAFSKDKEQVERFLSTKSTEEYTNVSTLKGLVYFLRFKPDDWLARTNQYALAASYALHFLIKGESEEDKDLIKRSLKHSDGGRSLISRRIQALFRTGSSCPMALLNAVERIYKNLAKSYVLKDNDEFALVVDNCFTSKAGLVRSFYRKVTKKEIKIVEEVNPRGKVVKTKKETLVHGLDAPKLFLGNEFLKDEENNRLRRYEARFPNEVQLLDAVLKRTTGDFLLPARAAKTIVQAAYDCSDRISKMLKRRKEATRVRAFANAGESKKITQQNWVTERNAVVSASTETIDEICTLLDSFEQDTIAAVLSELDSSA